jgi:hypothetical protein
MGAAITKRARVAQKRNQPELAALPFARRELSLRDLSKVV